MSARPTEDFAGRLQECQEFLDTLDDRVEAACVRDASSSPVPFFPYLRSDRFLSELKRKLGNEAEQRFWLQLMQEMDLRARKKEIRNLPDEVVLSLDSPDTREPDRERLYRRGETCSQILLDHDMAQSDFDLYETLYPLVNTPDEYSSFMRAVGLYPLAFIPVTLATAKVREEHRSSFNQDVEDFSIEGRLMTWHPAEPILLNEGETQDIIEESRKNALRVPTPDEAAIRRLVGHFAPVLIQDIAGGYDRFGRVKWQSDHLEIESESPSVYWYISHAFLKGEPILQINYVVWYPERAGRRSPWMERGHLDGLTVRVSLDTQGEPFMVDVVNNCGCYHLFCPSKDKVSRVVSKRFKLDPFAPQWLPTIPPGKRLGIRISSGWHQVQRLVAVAPPEQAAPYKLVVYGDLETLVRKDESAESMFDGNGIAKGTDRIEPFILFPMGIRSIGSMRQRGNHPISLTERVHFDDPDLFDRNFVFQ